MRLQGFLNGAAGRIRTADLILTNYFLTVFRCCNLLRLCALKPLALKGFSKILAVNFRRLLCPNVATFFLYVATLVATFFMTVTQRKPPHDCRAALFICLVPAAAGSVLQAVCGVPCAGDGIAAALRAIGRGFSRVVRAGMCKCSCKPSASTPRRLMLLLMVDIAPSSNLHQTPNNGD